MATVQGLMREELQKVFVVPPLVLGQTCVLWSCLIFRARQLLQSYLVLKPGF